METRTMVLTVWIGHVLCFGAHVGHACEVTPGCASFDTVRPTMDAEFEVVEEQNDE